MKADRFNELVDIANGLSNAELAFLLGIMRNRIALCIKRDCPIDGDSYHSIEDIGRINLNGQCVMIEAESESESP